MADIAIFRINYKSDFILTLQSDAGWATPFCIKFWTGAPSQAYFVGYDGTTYTHCAPVVGDPTKLAVQFDDHHLSIGNLKFQIGYHFTVADFPTTVEDEVINQAAVIIDQDGTPMQVMLDFQGETAPEIQFSLPAYANEAQRIANEQRREQEFAQMETDFETMQQESEAATSGAENVNAELDGNILTVTDRNGVSKSVNTKGEKGDPGEKVQSDWDSTDTNSPTYIKNKPSIYTKTEVNTLLNGKQDNIDSSHKLSADLVDDSSSTNKFVTSTEKSTWNGKQDALVSGTNIKTVNNTSVLGGGNISVEPPVDRAADAQTGKLGYKVLRGDASFASQVSDANTIYEIRDVFDLNNAEVIIPEYCVIKMSGGKICNGVLKLSAFCSVFGSSPDIYSFEDCYIKLNKRCTISDCAFIFNNATSDLITLNLSDIQTRDRFYSDIRIQLQNIFISNIYDNNVNDDNWSNGVSIIADVNTENTSEAGVFGLYFSGLNLKGRYKYAFNFETKYSNSWINRIDFLQCFIYGAKCGWFFNEADSGTTSGISIVSCGFQHISETTYAIIANKVTDISVFGSRFWDFGNNTLFQFDSGCVGVWLNQLMTGQDAKPYEMVLRGAATETSNAQIQIGRLGLYNGYITRFLSEKTQITVSDLFKIPDGLYLLESSKSNDFRTNWGVRLGDNYAENTYLSIQKSYGYLVAIVYNNKRKVAGSYNSGIIQLLCSNVASSYLVKDSWDYYIPSDSITLSMLNRIIPISGESHFLSSNSIPVWFDGTTWRAADSFIVGKRKGGTSSRPSDLAQSDKGYPYYDSLINAKIYWGGAYWYDVYGNNLNNVTALRGDTNTRTAMSLDTRNEGLIFYDTTLHKYVLWNGTAWVNMDGTALS